MIVSIEKNTIGAAASAIVHCGIAATAQMHEAQNIVHANLSSRLGSFHAEVNVGIEPRKITLTLVRIARTGLSNVCHNTMPRAAPERQNLSNLVHPGVPYFKAKDTTTHAPSTAPIIWPLTASFVYIPASVIVSRLAQIIHDAFAGLVSFRIIALMYGKKPRINNTPDTTVKTLFMFMMSSH